MLLMLLSTILSFLNELIHKYSNTNRYTPINWSSVESQSYRTWEVLYKKCNPCTDCLDLMGFPSLKQKETVLHIQGKCWHFSGNYRKKSAGKEQRTGLRNERLSGKGASPVAGGKAWKNSHQRRETCLWYRSFSIPHRTEDFLNPSKYNQSTESRWQVRRLTMQQLPE